MKSLEASAIAAWVWFITHFPLMCHTLYNIVLILTQILTGVLVVCRVIEALPGVTSTVKRWFKHEAS